MSDQALTDRIVAEVRRPGSTRESIATVYREGIRVSCYQLPTEFIDWPTVNRAILTRYTKAGLVFIKRLAWKRA